MYQITSYFKRHIQNEIFVLLQFCIYTTKDYLQVILLRTISFTFIIFTLKKEILFEEQYCKRLIFFRACDKLHILYIQVYVVPKSIFGFFSQNLSYRTIYE